MDLKGNKAMRLLQFKANVPAREVEGYAATWDLDDVGDRILQGAFSESLKTSHEMPIREKGRSDIRVLWQHNEPIGVLLEAREDEYGLWIRARISRTQLGDEALQLLADGAVDRMSIGYNVPEGGARMINGVRVISRVLLWEVSFVTFPANSKSVVDGVKDAVGAGTRLELKARQFVVAWEQKEVGMGVHWEQKAGRVQAGRNVERINGIMEHCKGVLEHCDRMLRETLPDASKEVDPNMRSQDAGGRGQPPSNHDSERDSRKARVTCPHCHSELVLAGDVAPLGTPEPKPDSVAELVPPISVPTPEPDSVANAYPGPYAVPEPKPDSIASAGGGYYDAESGLDQGKVTPVTGPVYDNPAAEGDSTAALIALAEGRRVPRYTWDDFVAAPMPTPGNSPGGSGPYPVPTPQPYSVAGQAGPEDAKGSNTSSSYDEVKAMIRSLERLSKNAGG